MLTAGARARKALWQPGVGARSLAAGAGEDWAALSGRPRKANADQYESVMQQRPLAALAEEDRAALSGRPRKANAASTQASCHNTASTQAQA